MPLQAQHSFHISNSRDLTGSPIPKVFRSLSAISSTSFQFLESALRVTNFRFRALFFT